MTRAVYAILDVFPSEKRMYRLDSVLTYKGILIFLTFWYEIASVSFPEKSEVLVVQRLLDSHVSGSLRARHLNAEGAYRMYIALRRNRSELVTDHQRLLVALFSPAGLTVNIYLVCV